MVLIREGSTVRFILLSLPLCLLLLVSYTDAGKLPPAPRKLRVRVISPHTVKLKWRDPGRHKGRSTRFYSVRYSRKGDESNSKFLQTQETRSRVTKLHPNTTYVFAVKSVAGKRGSPWSKAVDATTGVVENSIVTKLRATPLSSDSIRLSWKIPKVTNETVAYAILWSEVDLDKSKERTSVVANGSTSFVFENLRPHRVYSFRVRTMLSEGPGGSTEKYVLVTWRPPPIRQRNGPLLGYKIQYKRKGSRRGDLCTVITKPDDKQYVLTDIADGETYKVRIAATTVNGTGPYCKWEAVDIPLNNNSDTVDRKYKKRDPELSADQKDDESDAAPAKPEKVTAVDVRSTAVTLEWSQPDPPECCPIVAYRIITRNLNSSALSGDMVIGPTPVAKISFLLPDTEYGFNISAYSITGESEPSDELIVQTLPAEPPTILNVYGSSVVVGSSANLTCVVSAEPPPEVQWFGPNRTLAYSSARVTNLLLHQEKGVHVIKLHRSSRDVTSHLLMDSVTLEQAGTYTCEAKNSAGSSRMTVSLQVNVAPTIVKVGGAQVMDGMPAQLVCSVTGSPLPAVVWLREDTSTVYEEENVETKAQSRTSPYALSVAENSTVRTSYLHFPHALLSDVANYTCLARSIAGSTEALVPLQVQTPLPPPVQNIRALALSPHSVSVLWDNPFDYNYTIEGYRVSYREEKSGNLVFLDTQGRKLDVYGLRPNSTYYVNIRGYISNRMGAPSKDVKVNTLSNEGLQPANVSAVALNASMIQLDWASPKNIDRMYILGYNIYYRRENDTRVEMLFIEGNRNKQFLIGEYLDCKRTSSGWDYSGLGRDETYYLRIATLTTWGYEAPSQWIRIQKHPEELLPPVAPQDVKAVTMMDSIRVTWLSSREPDSKKSPVLGYRIVYGPSDDPSEINRMDLLPTATQFTIRGLKPSTKYIIAIRAFNKYAMSDPVYRRADTKAIPPTTVVNATATPLSATEIHVHWEPPERGIVTNYQIRYWRPGKRDKQSAWLKAPTTDYIAGSLKMFSNYRFEIIPYSNDIIGEGSVIFAETFSGRPDAPPSKVVMKPLNATHILVSWEAPEKESQNGVITGYKLIMKKKGGPRLAKFSVETTRRNYTFKNLEPGGTYKLRMAAMTVNGTGPFTDWIVSSTEEIEMRQPEKPESLRVETTANSITVRWSPPVDTGVPVMGYIVGHGRYIPEVYRAILGPGQREHVISGLKPDTEHIVSVRAFNHIGESHPQFTIVTTEEAPEKLKLEVPAKLTVRPLSPTTMEVSWVDPVVARTPDIDDGRQYLMRYSAISGEAYQYLNATSMSVNVTDLQVATTYEFAVRTTRGEEQSGWSLPMVNTTQQTGMCHQSCLNLSIKESR
ncbi:hypothetical protein BaRGS_00010986 [Batillaria attramentaria]|uniref:Fibronectin type III domain protein n=1 Tax=Batillaria attramentaria TaxID=370345 RepID=A0ABD0LE64_9CAEN